jgi:four helix bundle protein
MMPYERLTAWQAAHELALAIYEVTEGFPKAERFGLTSQLRRAAFSVPANIAEGVAKRGSREFRRFLDISIGSLSEISYAIRLATDLKMLAVERSQALVAIHRKASQLIWGLYKSTCARASG